MDIQQFIECVKEHPIIYSKRDYRDAKYLSKVAETWEEIALKMGKPYDYVRIKWKGLRDGYTKYKKQIKKPPNSAVYTYYNWCWGPHLTFLDNHVRQTKKQRMKEKELECASPTFISSDSEPRLPMKLETSSDDFITDPMSPTSTLPSTSACNHTEPAIEYEDLKQILNYIKEKSSRTSDDIDLLFASYAKTYRRLSIKSQTTLRIQMAEIFGNAELEEHSCNNQEMIEREDATIRNITSNEKDVEDLLIPVKSVPRNEIEDTSSVEVKTEMDFELHEIQDEGPFLNLT